MKLTIAIIFSSIMAALMVGAASNNIFRISAYCQKECCCGEYADGITASGHVIKQGDRFVAAPRRYPFGTMMVIEGYAGGKPVPVLDRGGAIRGNKIDLYFDDKDGMTGHERALQWGIKYIKVRIL